MAKLSGPVTLGTLALVSALLLSGCAAGAGTVSPEPSASESSSTAPTDSATPSPSSTASGTPLTIGCGQVLTLQNVYDFNPNYSEDPNFAVPSQITPLTAIGGVACGWVNQTSGDTFAVGIAKPDAATADAAANDAAGALQAVPTYGTDGVEGFFGVQAGTGVAEVFAKGYWIVLTSPTFLEPGDADPIVSSVLSNLN